jgi:ferredoxin
MASFLRKEIRRAIKTVVTILPSGQNVLVTSGSRLWEAVQLSGAAMSDHCGGRARCSVCHVMVLEGGEGLSAMHKDERAQLALIGGSAAKSRLSCQAVLGSHKVTIELVNH